MNQLVPGLPKNFGDNSTELILSHFFSNPQVVTSIMEQYPIYQFDQCYKCLVSTILKDYFFACSARRILLAIQQRGIPAWMYHFTFDGVLGDNLLGVYHGSELQFVFDNEWPAILNSFNEDDKIVADIFGTYWTNFAKYGNPNGNGTQTYPYWPPFQVSNQVNLIIEAEPILEQELRLQQCIFWDTLFHKRGCTTNECINCSKRDFNTIVEEFLLGLDHK